MMLKRSFFRPFVSHSRLSVYPYFTLTIFKYRPSSPLAKAANPILLFGQPTTYVFPDGPLTQLAARLPDLLLNELVPTKTGGQCFKCRKMIALLASVFLSLSMIFRKMHPWLVVL
ncbi:hypothetical protein I308_102777 [Cryptococcus tetragattii IND107]|uniref:Uncharacterized protein n=1 Tax=Cryptococcus tetragattii IND107 TaxID=1296105 RepID=A0ABR3BUI6_9TREE